MSFKNVYNGKRVVVTGHTGFKGSWLSLWLKQLGAEVHGIALEPKTPRDNFVVTGLKDSIRHHICDIKDKNALMKLMSGIRPQIVFHLAAQALVKHAFDDPADTYATNVLGSVHVLEAVRHTPSVETVVMITSDKCYKNVEWEWGYRETDELGGLDPYGASKACAELAIESYRQSFFNKPGAPVTASTRAGNVIGGGDWSDKRIVPDIIRALIDGNPIELRSPQATRPWQFVLEPLSGYLWLGARMNLDGDQTSGWNFGPEIATIVPVMTLTEKMVETWGSGEVKDMSDKEHFHEATLLSLDISKARHRLQWRPTLTLDETVEFTANWYKTFVQKEQSGETPVSMVDYGIGQITSYTEKARQRGIVWAM
jgi:CDP-glucose 4,6-dehydratase